jgi:hypothetical protein
MGMEGKFVGLDCRSWHVFAIGRLADLALSEREWE